MAALDQLAPTGLRLYATFRPVPLFAVMADKGFAHSERELDGGEWEVLFEPVTAPAASPPQAHSFDEWPEPKTKLDNRDLEPPEPMVRNSRRSREARARRNPVGAAWPSPVSLFPQLEKRGFRWLGGFTPDGTTYELTVRAPA